MAATGGAGGQNPGSGPGSFDKKQHLLSLKKEDPWADGGWSDWAWEDEAWNQEGWGYSDWRQQDEAMKLGIRRAGATLIGGSRTPNGTTPEKEG